MARRAPGRPRPDRAPRRGGGGAPAGGRGGRGAPPRADGRQHAVLVRQERQRAAANQALEPFHGGRAGGLSPHALEQSPREREPRGPCENSDQRHEPRGHVAPPPPCAHWVTASISLGISASTCSSSSGVKGASTNSSQGSLLGSGPTPMRSRA